MCGPKYPDRKLGQRNQSLAFAREEAIKMAANYNRIAVGGEWNPTRNPLATERGWQAGMH